MARFTEASQRERLLAENVSQGGDLLKQAEAQAQGNHLQAAVDLAQQALEKDPRNGNAHALLAKIYYSARRNDQAEAEIAKALEVNPIQPEFLYVQGKVLARAGKPDDALEAFRRATAINPAESDAYYEMGLLYQQKMDTARAAAAFKKALAISPNDEDYRKALAQVSGR